MIKEELSCKKEAIIQEVLSGLKSEHEAMCALGYATYDVESMSLVDFNVFSVIVRSIKACVMEYNAKLIANKKKRKELKGVDIVTFFYKRCCHFVKNLNTDGVVFVYPDTLIIDDLAYDLREGLSLKWSDNVLMGKLVTILLDDANEYIITDLFAVYREVNDNSLFDLVRLNNTTNIDKSYLFNVTYPNIRKVSNDRYYGIMNSQCHIYARDHYLRDQFIYLLSCIHTRHISHVAICNPNVHSILQYQDMGFKLYSDTHDSSKYRGNESSWITDLTGYYAIFDPYYFKDKRNEAEDALLLDKYQFIREVALGIGFLKYYTMGEGEDINYISGYDHYIYTPHKPCFYLFPEKMLNIKSHNGFFSLFKNRYSFFLNLVNKMRCAAYCIDMSVYDLDGLLIKMVEKKIIKKATLEFSRKLIRLFAPYFNFYTDYYNPQQIIQVRDDRRFISQSPVTVLFPNENSISTLWSISTRDIVQKRGMFLVREKKNTDSQKFIAYSNFKRQYMPKTVESSKKKMDHPGPYLEKDQLSPPLARLNKTEDVRTRYSRNEVRKKAIKWKTKVIVEGTK
jgi:hypothetical protein